MRKINFRKIFPIAWWDSGLVWLPWVLAFLVLDQVTKNVAIQYLDLGDSIAIFPGFNFTLVHNYGAAFGFLNQGVGWQQIFFVVLAIIASLWFIVWLARIPYTHRLEGFGIMLILSGALGNLYDRLQHGYVIDFLDVYYKSWHWPAFNLADSFICIGVALILLSTYVYANAKHL